MSKHMEIRDVVFEKLREMKGDRSYSDVIESLLNKSGIVMPDSRSKQPDITASTQP